MDRHILMKVFSLFSLLRNLENFTMRKEGNTLVTLYRYDSAFGTSVPAPYPLRVWGIVYLRMGIPEPLNR